MVSNPVRVRFSMVLRRFDSALQTLAAKWATARSAGSIPVRSTNVSLVEGKTSGDEKSPTLMAALRLGVAGVTDKWQFHTCDKEST